MAKLASFRINSRAIEEGEWVAAGDEWGDLEVKVRGFTNAYHDARNAAIRRAAVPYAGQADRIPSAIADRIVCDCVIKHLFLDVRNLTGDDGQPVTREQFVELMRNPDFKPLVNAVIVAAAKVGQIREAEAEAAEGNSARLSAGH